MKPNKSTISSIAVLTALLFVLVGFQNCSPVEFANIEPTLSEKGEMDDDFVIVPVDDDDSTEDDLAVDDDIVVDDEMPVDDDIVVDDDDKNLDGDDDNVADDNKGNSGDKGNRMAGACGDFTDIQLTVVALDINDASGKIRLVPAEPIILNLAALAAGVEFELDSAVTVNQIRLVLASEGNFMSNAEGENLFKLKTPSAQQSGFKLKASGDLAAGAYVVKANLDLSRQIVSTPNFCLLKPVVHDATIEAL